MAKTRKQHNREQYLKRSPRDWKNYALKKRYGISVDDYERMEMEQDGRCRICLRDGELLVVDHDHSNGNVRGLLCRKCNWAVGLLETGGILLERAKDYIKKGGLLT